MNEQKIHVIAIGADTGRITSRLVQRIAELQLTGMVAVEFKQLEDRITGTEPLIMVTDEAEDDHFKRLSDYMLNEHVDKVADEPEPKKKPIPWYHGKRRF